ncbi:putative intracellular protease/amidase [Xanthomonas arboricola]|uniref:DJ-1/PfpI family protein n=1 Tax=Xanthomonas TaxID=338 RepID=UPI000CEE077C|nr:MULTISPECIES: DJ-1/PfpI family protein [Xanthomonas]MBB5736475.1 putative intracellular protease/amidase [Xanthomonas sp. CFBP 8152]PPT79405.1 AraC family transcriptional regulator [Xanthomonas arboricola]
MAPSTVQRLARHAAWAMCVVLAGCAEPLSKPVSPMEARVDGSVTVQEVIPPYRARAGRARPVVVVVGGNAGVEVSDFLVPFGLLSRAGSMDVLAVTLDTGPLSTFTDLGSAGFRIATDMTVARFDASHPQGADYIVVPAQAAAPRLIAWLTQQAGQGATIVTICNGALIAAQMDMFDGRRATAHWSTASRRAKSFPGIRWTPNRRYIADGNWISTAGVSAAIPASIALVEAISGREKAQELASTVGAREWSSRHNSDAFRPRGIAAAWPLAKVLYTNRWLHGRDRIEVLGSTGVDEATLALTVDAYASTGRGHTSLVSDTGASVVTRHGLVLVPDRQRTPGDAAVLLVPADPMPVRALEGALDGILKRYGQATATGVALAFEYPDYLR